MSDLVTVGYHRLTPAEDPDAQGSMTQYLVAECDQVFVEESRDPREHRGALETMMVMIRSLPSSTRVVVIVEHWGLVGRSVQHLVSILDELLAAGHAVVAESYGWEALWDSDVADFGDVVAPPISARMALRRLDEARAFMASERIRRGQQVARAKGRAGGRPPVLTDKGRAQAAARVEAGENPARVAADLGVSRTTVMRAVERARTAHVSHDDSRGKGDVGESSQEEQQAQE